MSTATDILWQVTEAEYHADDTAWSRSMLETFRKSRRLAHGRYVLKTIDPPQPSESIALGSLVDCMVLSPDAVSQRYVVPPTCDRRTKAGKEQWSAFQDEHEGRTLVDGGLMLRAARVASAVKNSKLARNVLERTALSQVALRWRDYNCGFDRKCMCDAVGTGLIVDLKTSSNPAPESFARSVVNYGYHRQAAWYREAYRLWTGNDARFLFVVVGTEEPHDVRVYELPPGDLEFGHRQNHESLAQLAECIHEDRWTAPEDEQIVTLPLPGWAYQDWSL